MPFQQASKVEFQPRCRAWRKLFANGIILESSIVETHYAFCDAVLLGDIPTYDAAGNAKAHLDNDVSTALANPANPANQANQS